VVGNQSALDVVLNRLGGGPEPRIDPVGQINRQGGHAASYAGREHLTRLQQFEADLRPGWNLSANDHMKSPCPGARLKLANNLQQRIVSFACALLQVNLKNS